MHDITHLEEQGIPGAFVASSEFADAAAAQARALGFEPAAIYVPHPIQDRTDREIEELADNALEEIVSALVQNSAPTGSRQDG